MLDYKYCVKCGEKADKQGEYFQCSSCSYKLYPHSAITSSALIVKDGKVLLNKRNHYPHKGAVDVIGGFLNYGEHPEDGLVRETMEETNLSIKEKHLLGVYMDTYPYQNETLKTLNFFYIVERYEGEMEAKDDIAELFWQPIDTLPENVPFPAVIRSLRDLHSWYNNNK